MKNNFKHINYSVYLNSANLADEKVRRECCIAIFGAVDLSISSTVNKQILTPVAVCTSSVTHALNKKYTKNNVIYN